MGFYHGLSGLNASSKNLDVIGHNIANSNTTGFKSSRAEFNEMVASAMGAASGSNAGIGVSVFGNGSEQRERRDAGGGQHRECDGHDRGDERLGANLHLMDLRLGSRAGLR
jgi:flagellar hook protein FlgE